MKKFYGVDPKVGPAKSDQVTAFADVMIAQNAGVKVDPEADYDDEATAEVIDNMVHPGQIMAQAVNGRVIA